MSIEAYIPYDLRERLASQIDVIDKMVADAIAAERERCAKMCDDVLDKAGDMVATPSEYPGGVMEGARLCAAAIRGECDD